MKEIKNPRPDPVTLKLKTHSGTPSTLDVWYYEGKYGIDIYIQDLNGLSGVMISINKLSRIAYKIKEK